MTEKTFTVEIRCENAAFGETPEDACAEISRIISGLNKMIHGDRREYSLSDANGNTVGFAAFTGDWDEDDVFDTPEEYTISSHWLSYLINGDNSGYTDEEDELIQKWESEVMDGRVGHFSYPDDDSGDNFALCEVVGCLADCTTVTFWPNKKQD